MASVSRNPRPQFVTALPTGYDGQEVFYQSTTAGTGGGSTDTMATTGNVFHLRYRSASASSYKWEVIGAAPVSHASAGTTSASVVSGTFSQISATLDPRVTVPLAGEYYVKHGCALSNTTAGTNAIGVKLDTTEAGAFDAASQLGEQTVNAAAIALAGAGRVTMATANTVILQRYYKGAAGTTTLSLYNASLSVVPIRVG